MVRTFTSPEDGGLDPPRSKWSRRRPTLFIEALLRAPFGPAASVRASPAGPLMRSPHPSRAGRPDSPRADSPGSAGRSRAWSGARRKPACRPRDTERARGGAGPAAAPRPERSEARTRHFVAGASLRLRRCVGLRPGHGHSETRRTPLRRPVHPLHGALQASRGVRRGRRLLSSRCARSDLEPPPYRRDRSSGWNRGAVLCRPRR
jgi:hypothetical protein